MGGWIHLAVKPNFVSFKRKTNIGQKAFQNNNKKRKSFFWLFFLLTPTTPSPVSEKN